MTSTGQTSGIARHARLFFAATALSIVFAGAARAGGDPGQCSAYAKGAVAQNEEALRRNCGYGGPRWQSNYDSHYHWCMVDGWMFNGTQHENQARAEGLAKCQPKPDSAKTGAKSDAAKGVSATTRVREWTKYIRDRVWAGENEQSWGRYGNWVGRGWWGGSEDPNRPGMLAPVDDLDIPAYEFEPETAPQSAADYDDLALDTFGAQTAVQAQADAALDARFDTYFNDSLAGQNASGAYAPAEPAAYDTDPGISRYDADPGVSRYDAHAGAVHSNAGAYAAPSSMEAGVVDAGLDRDLSEGFEPAVHGRQRPNRGMLIAAVVAGVALIGGIGAFALTSGSGERAEDGSAVVLADKTPVKVKPENPGGAEVPNQDKKVYEQVAGKTVSQTPEQKTLVSKSEEPVDVAKQNVRVVTPGLNDDATAKSEARIDPKTASEPEQSPEVAAVTPRRVKTFVVRPDGTLVASEAPEPAAPAAKPVEVAKAEPAPKAEEPAALKPVAKPVPAAEPKPAAAKPVQTTTIKRQVQPESVPVVPSRPAEQPVNIVGTTRQAAAPAPTPAAAPAQQVASSPAWVQISSHPSRELAQTSYRNALARYGSIISGKGVNIAAADIPGRGTFHRVNIPAASFNEAVAMCKRIKAAGGDCLPKR